MMITLEKYVQQGRSRLRKWVVDPNLRLAAKGIAWFGSGFLLSGASLAHHPQPIAMGLVMSLGGIPACLVALGSALGYFLLWGSAGFQGILWVFLGLVAALALGNRPILDDSPLLMCSIAAFLTAASGLGFQIFRDDHTAVPVYLLRIILAAATAKLFSLVLERRDPLADWLAQGIFVLALSQFSLFPSFSLGFPAAGFLASGGAFPAAALAGLSLDLAQLTKTPMTAALCLAYLVRLLPVKSKWLPRAAPALLYLFVMLLCGNSQFLPALGLFSGSLFTAFLPPQPALYHRRGETGLAQVRLELMAGALSQTQHLLLEVSPAPIDEEALMQRIRQRACSACPCRKSCRQRLESLPAQLLHRAYPENTALPFPCKKPGRMIQELRRGQEQLRAIKADRQRLGEYRSALVQQYQFLAAFLQQLSDQLSLRGEGSRNRFSPEVHLRTAGKNAANGDRCLWFSGVGSKYYVLLCDGMGTGAGAAQEGQTAASLLRQMLSAGFPAEFALRSLNSLCCLRDQPGAVTVDLAELRLDSGRVTLYKWGAAPSYLLRDHCPEKIGTATPPPGLSVDQGRETVERLSLRRGEMLILISDGVDGEAALRRILHPPKVEPGELASLVLEIGSADSEDDATAAVIRLNPTPQPDHTISFLQNLSKHKI